MFDAKEYNSLYVTNQTIERYNPRTRYAITMKGTTFVGTLGLIQTIDLYDHLFRGTTIDDHRDSLDGELKADDYLDNLKNFVTTSKGMSINTHAQESRKRADDHFGKICDAIVEKSLRDETQIVKVTSRDGDFVATGNFWHAILTLDNYFRVNSDFDWLKEIYEIFLETGVDEDSSPAGVADQIEDALLNISKNVTIFTVGGRS